MRLSRFSDIGLRAMMVLGARRGAAVSTAELARRLNVSRDHLMKSLQALQGRGLVVSHRGRNGGFSISEADVGVRLGALIRALEPSLALAECFRPDSTCPLTGRCRLAGMLSEAQASFFRVLDEYTLADLVSADRPNLLALERRDDQTPD